MSAERTIQTRLDNIEVKVPKLVIALALNLTVIDAIVLERTQNIEEFLHWLYDRRFCRDIEVPTGASVLGLSYVTIMRLK